MARTTISTKMYNELAKKLVVSQERTEALDADNKTLAEKLLTLRGHTDALRIDNKELRDQIQGFVDWVYTETGTKCNTIHQAKCAIQEQQYKLGEERDIEELDKLKLEAKFQGTVQGVAAIMMEMAQTNGL